ncbi:MAG: hypothetical protein KGN02_05080 [bacterium]|nr:hypothetical protein [bacterium]
MLAALLIWSSLARSDVVHGAIIDTRSPVVIEKCDFSQYSNGNFLVDVTFRNDQVVAASNVKFSFKLLDAFGDTLDDEVSYINGLFSRGVTIKPRANQLTGEPET